MQYRATTTHPQPLSALGFGCMRFPRKRGAIDEKATFQLLERSVQKSLSPGH